MAVCLQVSTREMGIEMGKQVNLFMIARYGISDAICIYYRNVRLCVCVCVTVSACVLCIYVCITQNSLF